MLVMRLIKSVKIRVIWVVLVSLIFGLNFIFGFTIQEEHRRAWALQKNFWQALLPLIPDVEDGTVVLIEPSGLEDALFIDANTWNLPRVLRQMFVFPGNWEREPVVVRMVGNWQNYIMKHMGYYTIDDDNSIAPSSVYGYYPAEKAIFISTSSGTLERREAPLPLWEMIPLKPVGTDVLSTLATRPLYNLLILDD